MLDTAGSVFELGDAYLQDLAELDPLVGFMGGTGELVKGTPDFSTEGEQARAELAAMTLRRLDTLSTATDADRRAALVLGEKLSEVVQLWSHSAPCRNVRIHFTPPQMVHDVASHLPLDNTEEAAAATDYLLSIP